MSEEEEGEEKGVVFLRGEIVEIPLGEEAGVRGGRLDNRAILEIERSGETFLSEVAMGLVGSRKMRAQDAEAIVFEMVRSHEIENKTPGKALSLEEVRNAISEEGIATMIKSLMLPLLSYLAGSRRHKKEEDDAEGK